MRSPLTGRSPSAFAKLLSLSLLLLAAASAALSYYKNIPAFYAISVLFTIHPFWLRNV